MLFFGGLELLLIGFICLFALASFAFWVWMLVDCAQAPDRPGSNDRVVWILVLVFTSWVGAIVYYFAVRLPRRRAVSNVRYGVHQAPPPPPFPPATFR